MRIVKDQSRYGERQERLITSQDMANSKGKDEGREVMILLSESESINCLMIGLEEPQPDTLSDSSDDDEIIQIHSMEPQVHWFWKHWKISRSNGGWRIVECKCTLPPNEIVYNKSYGQMKQELK